MLPIYITHMLFKIFILVWLWGPAWMRMRSSGAYAKTCGQWHPWVSETSPESPGSCQLPLLALEISGEPSTCILGQVTKYLAVAGPGDNLCPSNCNSQQNEQGR